MDSHELIIKLSTSSDGPHIFNEPIVSELNFLGGLFISGNDMIAGGGGIINKWKTHFLRSSKVQVSSLDLLVYLQLGSRKDLD